MGKRNKIRKATNDVVSLPMLVKRTDIMKNAGYGKPKWIGFCENLLNSGYTLTLYEARQTFSKYISVSLPGHKPFKVRFSNHKPIAQRELNGDCDFFVGVTNLRVTNTAQALVAVEMHFNQQPMKGTTNV